MKKNAKQLVVLLLFLPLLFLLSGCAHHVSTHSKTTQIPKTEYSKEYIYFDVNSAELNLESKENIKSCVQYASCFGKRLELQGYADITGLPEKNMELSQKRVDSVKNFFLSLGFNEFNITETAFGSDKPIMEGNSPEINAKNRCVVVNIYDK